MSHLFISSICVPLFLSTVNSSFAAPPGLESRNLPVCIAQTNDWLSTIGGTDPEPEKQPPARVVPSPAVPPDGEPTGLRAQDIAVRIPATVRAGEEVRIEVEAANRDVVPRIGTIAVSIAGGAPAIPEKKGSYDVFLPGGKSKIARFAREGDIWRVRRASESIFPSVPHVEWYDGQWPARAGKKLSIPVVFRTPGSVVVFVRVTFSARTASGVVVDRNYPDGGNELDEQGLPCYRFGIDVQE